MLITNLKGFQYNTGGILEPPPMNCFVSMANLVQLCQNWAKYHAGPNKQTWTLEVQNGRHNHEASPGVYSHMAHKTLLPKQDHIKRTPEYPPRGSSRYEPYGKASKYPQGDQLVLGF
ncbi:hypothetical protein PTTG_27061 [Puccinia triticina 1-1 BBBD Race 1]|uniref:Uncharacterized protein n=1 Tax=Puccinia triticina (isolate 1-1 / race 1 (BBBD)) TaxID=630390 RepID=A0A180GP62_PUCT1|nr:hypothetical protein PTTG_27061 [Puccinia triticina 1-1 BBBD Race 1]